MSESHLARTLFSQTNNAPVRKKQLLPASQEKTAKPDQQEVVDSWQDKCHALEQKCQELLQQLQAKEQQVKELQTTLAQQTAQNHEQTMLISALQEQNQKLEKQVAELEAKLDHHLQLLLSSEITPSLGDNSRQQISELQEQILHQADQIKEYQATIQHWKDQAIKHQQHAIQLSSALERLLSEKPPTSKTGKSKSEVNPEPKREPTVPRARIELPSFLTRAR